MVVALVNTLVWRRWVMIEAATPGVEMGARGVMAMLEEFKPSLTVGALCRTRSTGNSAEMTPPPIRG